MKSQKRLLWAAGFAALIPLTTNAAEPGDAPIADALASVSDEVRVYNDHLTILASPWMEGRVPGSRGMELAKEYVETHFRDYGLLPAFPLVEEAPDGSEKITPGASYRQPFPLGGTTKVTTRDFAAEIKGQKITFEPGTDFSVLGLGKSGVAEGDLVFVGYSIAEGPDDYSSFNADDDLTGKIALMLRFEPVDDQGNSRWVDEGWTPRASFNAKINAIRGLNPAAIVIINPPGTHDPRANQLMGVSGSGRKVIEVPVIMMSTDAADRLIKDADGRSLTELRELADQGRAIVPLNADARIATKIETESLMAENVGAILPGKGNLADEYIVVGGHLDHLGMGYFGSRSGPGELHPGADDNASGSAGVLLFAEKMAAVYEALPEDANARSIIFMCFSGEESGLNGSRYYTNHPIVPLDDHALMINFDMIGRIKNSRLSVSGYKTAEGMQEWLQPYFQNTPLTVVQNDRLSGASDHSPFMAKKIPVLFGIIADFHADYHTPDDVSTKINRLGAVQTIDLFSNIATGIATRPERFTWAGQGEAERRPTQRGGEGGIKVRVGIMPGYNTEDAGVQIENVSPNSPASKAGILPGDRLVRWDGQKIEDIMAWMDMLAENKPGQELKIGVMRDGQEVTLDIKLEGK